MAREERYETVSWLQQPEQPPGDIGLERRLAESTVELERRFTESAVELERRFTESAVQLERRFHDRADRAIVDELADRVNDLETWRAQAEAVSAWRRWLLPTLIMSCGLLMSTISVIVIVSHT